MSNDDASLIALNEAGCMILYLVHHAVRLDAGQKPRLALPRIHVKFLLVECRRLLDAVTMRLAPYKAGEKKRLEKLHLRYQAARQALRILEDLEAGRTIADAEHDLVPVIRRVSGGRPQSNLSWDHPNIPATRQSHYLLEGSRHQALESAASKPG
jgi:hypothetical protein